MKTSKVRKILFHDELDRRRIRYDELCPCGVTIHLDNLAAGPDRLESEAHIRLS